MSADRKPPAVTATMHTNFIQAAEHRRDQATRRLTTLSNYVFGEGFQIGRASCRERV